jgi:hypothetical protein
MAADYVASRVVSIWRLVAQQAASRGGGVSVADVCAAAVAEVAVSGAGLIVVTRPGAVHVMCVTDKTSELLADIELTLGEGPCADTAAFSGPVLASDLADGDAAGAWPVFLPAARAAGAAAIFAFPLQIGAIRVGVLELYRRQPGPLSTRALGDALLFADAATLLLLDGQGGGGQDGDEQRGDSLDGQPIGLGLRRAKIDQATGMLTEQLGTGIEEAFIRLRAYAYAQDRPLAEVAHDIVSGWLRLRPDGRPGPDGAPRPPNEPAPGGGPDRAGAG